jgi:hypothetical protein
VVGMACGIVQIVQDRARLAQGMGFCEPKPISGKWL